MAGFMLKAAMLFVLAQLGAGATLHSEAALGAQLLRREATNEQPVVAHIGHDGKMQKLHGDTKLRDFCRDNYIADPAGKPACPAAGQHKTMEDMNMCKEAANEYCRKQDPPITGCWKGELGNVGTSCPACQQPAAMIAAGNADDAMIRTLYPSRCFMTEAKEWFWNEFGPVEAAGHKVDPQSGLLTDADGAKATPICYEEEYNVLKEHAEGATECPKGYEVIGRDRGAVSGEDACKSAAVCLGFKPEEVFKVLESANGAAPRPFGCHVNLVDEAVEFNPFGGPTLLQLHGDDDPTPAPTTAAGADAAAVTPKVVGWTPICELIMERGSDTEGTATTNAGSATEGTATTKAGSATEGTATTKAGA